MHRLAHFRQLRDHRRSQSGLEKDARSPPVGRQKGHPFGQSRDGRYVNVYARLFVRRQGTRQPLALRCLG